VGTKRTVPEDLAASVDESSAASDALTEDDLLQLYLYGRLRITRIGKAADDRDHMALLGEALNRTLEGKRRWNKKLSFVQHLKNTMQSISGHWVEKFVSELKGREKIRTDLDSCTDLMDSAESAASFDPFGDSDERLPAVRALFNDDAEAAVIVGGWEDGLKGPELKQILGWEEKAYRTKVRWIQRKLIAAGYRRPTATQKGPRP
jgi:hypothetical protein